VGSITNTCGGHREPIGRISGRHKFTVHRTGATPRRRVGRLCTYAESAAGHAIVELARHERRGFARDVPIQSRASVLPTSPHGSPFPRVRSRKRSTFASSLSQSRQCRRPMSPPNSRRRMPREKSASSVSNAAVLPRGRYMLVTGHCNNCHTVNYGALE